MNLFDIFRRFPDHEACIEHLETIRWGDAPQCPYCDSFKVARKAERNVLDVGIVIHANPVLTLWHRLFFRKQKCLCKSGFWLSVSW